MRWLSLAAALPAMGAALVACGVPAPASSTTRIPPDCPTPPEPRSVVELTDRLSATLREARANLMMSGVHDDYGAVTVILHHARIALIQAILGQPKRAQEAKPEWLHQHLNAPFVEIRAERPGPLSEGDLSGISLSDEGQRRYPLLYATERRDGSQTVYRLFYDGPLETPGESGLARVSLSLGARFGKALPINWAVSRGNLRALDRLPFLFTLSQLQQLRLARKYALSGQSDRAKEALLRLRSCAPALTPQISPLLAARPSDEHASSPSQVRPAGKTKRGPAASNVSDALALRLALWDRLRPAVQGGLVDATQLVQTHEQLQRAARAHASGAPVPAQTAAIVAFDAALAKALASGLALGGAPAGQGPDLAPITPRAEVSAPAAEAVEQDLRDRVARAERGLVPRWVSAREAAPTWPTQRAVDELRPVISEQHAKSADGRVVAQATIALGPGWHHPGLPAARYRIEAADYGALYWRRRVAQAQGPTKLAQIATEILARAQKGPDGGAATRSAPHETSLSAPRAAAYRLSRRAGPAQRGQLKRLSGTEDPYIRAAANLGLWRLGDGSALLALGATARADCATRELVLPALSRAMDPKSRRQLLSAALRSSCRGLAELAWPLVARHHHEDEELLRLGLGCWWRTVRTLAALSLQKSH